MTLEALCLGTGMGKTHVHEGTPSSAFALLRDGHAWLLMDCGLGVLRSAVQQLGSVPATMFLTHNHADHTGDLPYAIKATTTRPQLLGHPDVLRLVREVRFHDAPRAQQTMIDAADWHPADDQNRIALDDWLFELHRARHSYLCYGVLLSHRGVPRLAYSADSGFDAAHYAFLSRAPFIVLDGRLKPHAEHAGFAEIDRFAAQHPAAQMRVVHHGGTLHTFRAPNVRLWQTGERERIDL